MQTTTHDSLSRARPLRGLAAGGVALATPARLPLAQVAASEGQHAGAIARLLGHPVSAAPFPAALSIGTASQALDAFES